MSGAAITCAQGRTVSAGEFADRVHGAAAVLAAHGVARAATVCLLTGNRPQTLVARYAANLLGARVVHLDPAMTTGTQATIVRSTGATALIVDPAARARPRRCSAPYCTVGTGRRRPAPTGGDRDPRSGGDGPADRGDR
ncbi:AMP-binding protein [Streptomyces sp. NPDC060028]|uniref:AMP-binding protein n=1 Tax=Streptomyces sp. NPDC060028 TaxID=3347041 RepID=UPI0036966AFC